MRTLGTEIHWGGGKNPDHCTYLAFGGVMLPPTKKHVVFSSALPFSAISPKTGVFFLAAIKPENVIPVSS